jgi:ATP-dependent DNA helicase RecG
VFIIRARVFLLSAEIYRRFRQAIGYVRQRGFEPLQQEALILQYVQTHQRISRHDVMSLCKLNEDQAPRLLRRLVNAGKLTLRRAGRSSFYTAASTTKG